MYSSKYMHSHSQRWHHFFRNNNKKVLLCGWHFFVNTKERAFQFQKKWAALPEEAFFLLISAAGTFFGAPRILICLAKYSQHTAANAVWCHNGDVYHLYYARALCAICFTLIRRMLSSALDFLSFFCQHFMGSLVKPEKLEMSSL